MFLCPHFTHRQAKLEDLDWITNVHLEGFTKEPQVQYCYPYRHQYWANHAKWTRKEYEEYFAQPEKYLVQVLDGPVDCDEGVVDRPIGVAVWNMAVKIRSSGTAPNTNARLDTDEAHCRVFFSNASQRFDKYFAKWGEEQINLATLVVHPDYRRRGAGTTMVNWGIEEARKRGWPVTLCASPMGRLLYLNLGFEQIQTEVSHVAGEDEKETLECAVMVFEGQYRSAARCLGRS